MNKTKKYILSLILSLFATTLLFTGCESDDGISDDVGDNNVNLVACIGDSLTQGYSCLGAPYPSKLSAMIGKTVLNYGVGGATSEDGTSKVKSALAQKPGYMCILYGANDAIRSRNEAETINNLRFMIGECKKNHTIPLIGNVTPMIGEHSIFNGKGERISDAIRQLAKEEGVIFVNVRSAFGSGEGLLNTDGLHYNDEGGTKLAQAFASKF